MNWLECCYIRISHHWKRLSTNQNQGPERMFVCFYTVWPKLLFSPAKNGFKWDISIFCCSVSRKYQKCTFPNIHFAINCNNRVRFLSDNSQCSTDIWSHHHHHHHHHQSVWNDIRNWTNWDRLNTKELWQRLFKRSTCKATRKTMRTYRAKAALNTKDGHTKCWFNLVNRS